MSNVNLSRIYLDPYNKILWIQTRNPAFIRQDKGSQTTDENVLL